MSKRCDQARPPSWKTWPTFLSTKSLPEGSRTVWRIATTISPPDVTEKSMRLDMGIDHAPVPGPVAAQPIVSPARSRRPWPLARWTSGVDQGQDAVDVAGIEALVDAPRERQLVEHRGGFTPA